MPRCRVTTIRTKTNTGRPSVCMRATFCLSTTNKPKDEVPKIQAQAEALLKQIKGGGDFAELAKKESPRIPVRPKRRRFGLGVARPDGEELRRHRLRAKA